MATAVAPLPKPALDRFADNINRVGTRVSTIVGRILSDTVLGDLGLEEIIDEKIQEFNDADRLRSLNTFIYYSYDQWQMILNQETKFFIEHGGTLLAPAYKNMAEPFIQIFKDNLQTKGEEADLWLIIHNCIKSALRHMLENNINTVSVTVDKDTAKETTKTKTINVREWASNFKMKI